MKTLLVYASVLSAVTCCITHPHQGNPQTITEQSLLPFYRETDHFKLFCTAQDHEFGDEIVDENEQFMAKLEQKFDYQYKEKIDVIIFPDQRSFHTAINKPSAPSWVVAWYDKNCIKMVSPQDPDIPHSKEDMKKSSKNGTTVLLIIEKYQDAHVPRWLRQGVALYLTAYYKIRSLHDLTQINSHIPTIEELETSESTGSFDAINGFFASYSLVQYLDTAYGWNMILQIIENYSKLEELTQKNKEEIRNDWLKSLSKRN